ncbi:MAG: helix-turn-helix domain-containing protein [Candidatus Kuenenia sp.]|nr:helix-turn-helix domain-containing protein [Candidatus Kuenenia hertensis]
MEKLCIVKRRKQGFLENNFNALSVLSGNTDIHSEGDSTIQESLNDDNNVITFRLTQEQCNVVKSNEYVNSLMNTASNDSLLNLRQQGTGQIIFKFYLEKPDSLKMLKPRQVCQMLQISKSFLKKLILKQKIKSYKLGKLRRVSMDDVLDYLAKNVESEAEKNKPTF